MRKVCLPLALLAASSAGFAQAQTWQRLGPPGGMVVALSASGGVVYLGTADGHVFASTDRGEHWELRGRAGNRLDGVVQRIVPDARTAGRALAALWFRDTPGGGVFESLDGARHWKLTGLGEEAVRTLEHSESEPQVWIAGTRRGVFRSDDDAKTWRRITPASDPELQNIDSLAIDPRDGKTIYVGTYHLPWKSEDGGQTWKSIAAGMIDDSDIMSLRIDAQNPRRIFSSACSGIYRSEDGGANWVKLQGIPYSSRRTQQIVQDPSEPRSLYAATTEGLWITSDSGETWKRITGRETDANAVVVLPGEKGKRILAGFDAQGVLRSDDAGRSFAQANGGFAHRVIFSLAADPRDPRHLLTRAEGFGGELLESPDMGATWKETSATAGRKSVDRVFGFTAGWWATLSEGGAAKFDAAKAQWTEVPFRELIPRPVNERALTRAHGRRFRQVSPHVVSLIQSGDSIFAATDQGLWKIGLDSGSFQRVLASSLPASLTFLVAGTDGAQLAIAGGTAWRSNSQASVWTSLSAPADTGSLLWIGEWRLKGQQLSLLGTEKGVFFSEDHAGWRLLSNGLPATSSVQPAMAGRQWVLTMSNGGTYVSEDGLKSWRRVDQEEERARASVLLTSEGEDVLVGSRSEGVLHLKLRDSNTERTVTGRIF